MSCSARARSRHGTEEAFRLPIVLRSIFTDARNMEQVNGIHSI